MTTAAISRVESDLSALDACVERAGAALGCCYSSADEFEAERVRLFRRQRDLDRHVFRARMIVGATAVTSLALLFVLTL